jgi:hypothetical protein
MNPLAIVAVLAVVSAVAWLYFNTTTGAGEAKEVVVVKGSQAGDIERTVRPTLPVSFNQPEGLTYSYTGWVLVKDFGKGYGKQRRIFSNDDSPGLYIDSTSNSFVVAVKTFGTTETILIPNVPAMKWIHVGIVVDQQSVDVYINGTLRQHHTLSQLPKQTTPVVTTGPGWDGVLADLVYYPRTLRHTEIKKLSQDAVPVSLQRVPASPQYFDISWYVGRFYSK